jgi:hypothetical protein
MGMMQMTCATKMPVALGDEVRTAREWAEQLGVNWDTVRQRRYRGSTWAEALTPGRLRSPFSWRR